MHRRPPSCIGHRRTGQAVVIRSGRDFYLGKHDSLESRAEYDRLIAEWPADSRGRPGKPAPDSGRTIDEVIAACWGHFESDSVKSGRPASEQDTTRQAMRSLRHNHGRTRAVDIGPVALKAVRQAMVERRLVRKVKATDAATGQAVVKALPWSKVPWWSWTTPAWSPAR